MADREWILLNPGPANTTHTVRAALGMPDLCHREPEYFDMMRRCRAEVTRLAGCGTEWTTVLFTGSGTAAVEATICSAVPADRALLVVDNGVYGDRMLKIARAHGIPAHAVRSDLFTPVRPSEVEAALAAHPDVSHVALVHHETTTGLLNPVAEVARVAQRRGRRVIVDAMSSLFGEPLDVCQEPLDFVTASANKCLQGVPGVSFVLARRSAPEGRSNILTTFRLPSGLAYDALHDALKRRGYVIYAGQGDLRTYAFRVANMGTLTPRDMAGVVEAFAAAFAELGVPAPAL